MSQEEYIATTWDQLIQHDTLTRLRRLTSATIGNILFACLAKTDIYEGREFLIRVDELDVMLDSIVRGLLPDNPKSIVRASSCIVTCGDYLVLEVRGSKVMYPECLDIPGGYVTLGWNYGSTIKKELMQEIGFHVRMPLIVYGKAYYNAKGAKFYLDQTIDRFGPVGKRINHPIENAIIGIFGLEIPRSVVLIPPKYQKEVARIELYTKEQVRQMLLDPEIMWKPHAFEILSLFLNGDLTVSDPSCLDTSPSIHITNSAS